MLLAGDGAAKGSSRRASQAQRATGAQPEQMHRWGWSVEPWVRILPLLVRVKVPPQLVQTPRVVLVVGGQDGPSRSADSPQKVSR